MPALIDLTGKKFGKLTVIQRVEDDKYGNVRWLCRCECGNLVIRHGHVLRRNRASDCGCGKSEFMTKIATTHGGRKSRLYSIWIDMIRRCEDLKVKCYYRYGGRGISVCPEWHDFSAFRKWSEENGYSSNLTLDRIDNDNGYCPQNCRWVPMKIQENNKSNNTQLCFKGKIHTLSQWSEITGIHRATISRRISKYGWSVERALTEPVHTDHRKKR